MLDANLNAVTEETKVDYIPGGVKLDALARAVEDAGLYRAAPAAPASEAGLEREGSEQDEEYRRLMRKWWFGVAIAIPTMFLSYASLFPVLRDVLARGSTDRRLAWALMVVASLAVMAYSGNQFFVGMWQGLKHRSANMHTLIAVGTGVAWIYSTIALLFPQIFPSAQFVDVYYDVAVVVTSLVVLGLALETRARGRTSEAIKS